MAHICITTYEKSENEQVKNRIHAHLLFYHPRDFHTEFVTQGQTVNQFYYREILERLRKRAVRVLTIGRYITTKPFVTWRSL